VSTKVKVAARWYYVVGVALIVTGLALFSAWPYLMHLSGFEGIPTGGGTGTGKPWFGTVVLSFPFYNSYDSTPWVSAYPTILVYHADKSTLFGSLTNANNTLSGALLEQDAGILYVVEDVSAATTFYLDDARVKSSNPMITTEEAWDYKSNGILSYLYQVDLTYLPPLTGGQKEQAVTINNYVWATGTLASMAGTSQLNATGVGTTSAYADAVCTGYYTGITSGQAFKLVKVYMTLPDAANASYVDNGYIKNVYVSVGYGYNKQWTFYDTGSWDLANKQWVFNIGVTDLTQQYYGKLAVYEQNAPTTVFSYTVHVSAANFGVNATIYPTLRLKVINSAGTPTTVVRPVLFTYL